MKSFKIFSLVLIYLFLGSASILPSRATTSLSTASRLGVLKPASLASSRPARKTVSRPTYRDGFLRSRDSIIPPQGSGGVCGGSSNGCWGNFSIETDPETTWPNTGRIVEYNLTIVNTTCAPDGIPKPCLLFNNQFPGPIIEANWGDWLKITVNNQLQDNGTVIHWHGIRQKGTNDQDGVNGLTECRLVPGHSRTYMWQATSFGTSWYHSHASTQYGDGVVGPMVIHGPTSAGYDIDLGPVAISEIYRAGGAAALDTIITTQGPLKDVPDNILFNGMNVNPNGGGQRLQLSFESGKRHLIRFINTGVDNFYKVGIDSHMMQVIAIDFTPVEPYTAQYVRLGIGQRMDVIVTANNTVGNYWLRAIPMSCVENNYDGKGIQNPIISYNGAPASLPTTTAAPLEDDGCLDEPAENTIPFVANPVDISNFDPRHLPVASPFQVTSNDEGRVFRWSIGNTTQNVDLENPILQRLFQGNSTITPEDNIIGVDEKDTWAFWYLQNNFYEPHPIHMHGNDLRILSTGQGQWDEDITKLSITNPMRRDTFMLPAGGYAVLAFFTDNPGIWLMHCHISWHISEGLSTSLFVRKDDIVPNVTIAKNIQEGCLAWDQFLQTDHGKTYPLLGSGV